MEKTLLQIAKEFDGKDLVKGMVQENEAMENLRRINDISNILECSFSTAMEIFVKYKRKK